MLNQLKRLRDKTFGVLHWRLRCFTSPNSTWLQKYKSTLKGLKVKTAHALSSGKLTNVAVSATYSQHNSNGAKASTATFVKMQKSPKKLET